MAESKKFEIQIVTSAETGGAVQTARALEDVGSAAQKSGEGMKEAGDGAKRASISHEDFHAILKGLKSDFPELERLAKMATNPITLSAFAMAGAWELFQRRVEEATKALSAIQIADNPALEPGRVSAAAAAWSSFHDAIEKTRDSYASVDAAANRATQRLNEQHDAQVKVMEAQKALDLSTLDANKSGMSEAQYTTARLAIEQRYGKAGLAADLSFMQQQQAAKEDTTKEHGRAAAFALAEASKIPVLQSKAEDDATYAKMKADADRAREDNKAKQEELNKYFRVLDGEGSYADKFSTMSFLGTDHLRQQIALLQQGMADNKTVIDNANAFGARLPGREEQRQRRADLMATGAAEAGAFENGADGFAGDRKAFNESTHNTTMLGQMNSLRRVVDAYARIAAEMKQIADQISSSGAEGKGIPAALLRQYAEDRATLADLQRQINAIKKQTPIATQ